MTLGEREGGRGIMEVSGFSGENENHSQSRGPTVHTHGLDSPSSSESNGAHSSVEGSVETLA